MTPYLWLCGKVPLLVADQQALVTYHRLVSGVACTDKNDAVCLKGQFLHNLCIFEDLQRGKTNKNQYIQLEVIVL